MIDSGEEYDSLRGVELSGTVEFVGEIPRTGELCAELDAVETLFARKNFALNAMPHDGRHAWIRLRPEKIVSWDFRKLADR
ncbi:Pyridoxamine 5'-phosphate oxidase OS=Streptomyces aurantiogriseus OX=66870 GN=GCM10010251_49100 PE=4 SV=1 [Streptomyces aurantiogriseus]